MKKLCKKAEVKNAFGFHSIRHLAATNFYHSGQKIAFIQAFLRHKAPTTTELYLKRIGCTKMDEELTKNQELFPGFDQALASDFDEVRASRRVDSCR